MIPLLIHIAHELTTALKNHGFDAVCVEKTPRVHIRFPPDKAHPTLPIYVCIHTNLVKGVWTIMTQTKLYDVPLANPNAIQEIIEILQSKIDNPPATATPPYPHHGTKT